MWISCKRESSLFATRDMGNANLHQFLLHEGIQSKFDIANNIPAQVMGTDCTQDKSETQNHFRLASLSGQDCSSHGWLEQAVLSRNLLAAHRYCSG